MKYYFLLPVLLLFNTSICISQWTSLHPVPDGNDLNSVFFIDDETGWIIGSDGFVIRTMNAGQDWIKQNSETPSNLNSVKFINSSTGWIAGDKGTIIRTTNGGLNWNTLSTGTTKDLRDIHFYDCNKGWAVGADGKILKTTNGGNSWSAKNLGDSIEFYSVDFVGKFKGWAVGFYESSNNSSGIIFKTTNGGHSWINITTEPIDQFSVFCVEFIDELNGWLGGANGRLEFLAKTTDGGQTWIQLFIPLLKFEEGVNIFGIHDIYFSNQNTGYFVRRITDDETDILKTTDGGLTWTQLPGIHALADNLPVNSIFATSTGNLWAVGLEGKILMFDDDEKTFFEYLSTNNSERIINSVFFIDKTTGWAAGVFMTPLFQDTKFPIILKTTDGGKYWQKQLPTNPVNNPAIGDKILNDIYFIDQFTGWTIGNSELMATTNGGQTWIVRAVFDDQVDNFSSLFFLDKNLGWAVNQGINTGIYKTTNGGFTWNLMHSEIISSIFFSDTTTGLAVGSDGLILKTTDGGNSWIKKSSGTTVNLNDIKFFDSEIGICVGNSGTTLFTFDSGENWIVKISGITDNLGSADFSSMNTVWAAGANGKIISSSNFGNTWKLFNDVTSDSIISIGFFSDQFGWAAGGSLFQYHNGSGAHSEPVWSNQISISGESIYSVPTVLTFGQHLYGTAGIDYTLGEFGLTPPVPSTLDSRFILPIASHINSFLDFRDSVSNEINWQIVFQPGSSGYPLTFRWDSSRFPMGTFFLIDTVDGTTVFIDMKNQNSFTLTDQNITSLMITYNRNSNFSGGQISLTEIANRMKSEFPISFELFQNYPNPFNPSTTIRFAVPNQSIINLSIYNILGELVSTLVHAELEAGYYEYNFDAASLSSGVYLYKFIAVETTEETRNSYIETRKMLLVK